MNERGAVVRRMGSSSSHAHSPCDCSFSLPISLLPGRRFPHANRPVLDKLQSLIAKTLQVARKLSLLYSVTYDFLIANQSASAEFSRTSFQEAAAR